MSISSYLIFKIGAVRFGIEAKFVQEIVRLPELSPLEEAPPYIKGLINLRGRVIPVLDLNLRLGRRSPPYRLSDALVVLHQGDKPLGIIINEVVEVIELPPETIEPVSGFSGAAEASKQRLIHAVARTDSSLILLLDQFQLFRFAPLEMILDAEVVEALAVASDEPGTDEGLPSLQHGAFLQGLNAKEQQEFRQRAQQLQKPLVSEELEGSMPLAVIKLAGEYLAVELSVTEGFAILARLTPIPCCPPHIMGSMNLRGNNLTVVDIRGLLNIPYVNTQPPPTVMVVTCDSYSLGVPIDEVVDVVYLRAAALNRMPTTINTVDQQYLKGMTTYAQQMLAVVDLPKLLARPELTVYEM